jgi:WD40 repeat protein
MILLSLEGRILKSRSGSSLSKSYNSILISFSLYFGQKNTPLIEFAEHTSDVTAVQFSKSSPQRAFSASLDKSFKVYDIPAKVTLKSI